MRICIYRLLVIFSLVLVGGACRDTGKDGVFILLHTNDSHGSILSVDGVGGMAERASFIRMVRDSNPEVLLVDAGDLNTGQAVSNMFDARPDIEAYNYMGYDAVTAGNHEFDKPVTVLQKQIEWAEFPFVISNILYQDKPLGEECIIKQMGNVKFGIFGLTIKNTAHISVYAQDLFFADEVVIARKMVKKLRKENADIIIGLVHLGFVESTPDFVTSCKLAREVEGIDILVDGHSHSYIEQPVKVNDTWIVTANQSGAYVGKGKLSVENGHLKNFEWKPVKIQGYQPDSVLLHQLSVYTLAAEQDLQTVIGETTQEFTLLQDGVNLARYRETALGNLVADALKWKAGELQLKADFGLTNSGGIRAGLPAGNITKGDILSVLPFNNVLEIIALRGKDVRQLFDFLATVTEGNGAFAQVSKEVKVVYDRTAKLVKSISINGLPLEDERLYYMATCDYVAAGKDGYAEGLREIKGRENTSLLLSQVMMDYIKMKGRITPEVDGRMKCD